MGINQVNVSHFKIENTPVIYVKADDIRFIEIHVLFAAGSCFDSKPGISQLVNVMLNQGTKSLSASEIALGFENSGAMFSADADRDMAIIKLRCLATNKYHTTPLKILTEILKNPNFPQKNLSAIKKRFIGAVQLREQMPDLIAKDFFYNSLYGNHPYGQRVMGTPESIHSITRKELMNFYKKFYVANNAKLTIVGNVTLKEVKTIASKIIKSLSSGVEASYPPVASTKYVAKNQFIPFPSAQTYLLMGCLAIDYQNQDYFPLLVANQILGGSTFTSRLFEQVRLQRGLAYDAISLLSPHKLIGNFAIAIQTRNEQAKVTLKLAQEIFHNFIEKGITKKELKNAKNELINKFPHSISTCSNLANLLDRVIFYQLPFDYLNIYQKKIKNVSLQETNNAIRKYLNMDKIITVAVGK